MRLKHLHARRFESVLDEGRTLPLVLGCEAGDGTPVCPKVVKAVGLPEIASTRPLVAEVVGNAVARKLGVPTAEPCVVNVDEHAAGFINRNLRELGYSHSIQSGSAAGCEYMRPAPVPYAIGQNLTPELRQQATWIYIFDLMSQNPDRRAYKVNCGLTDRGLIAFDFEMCFGHLFLPIIGGPASSPWEPSLQYPVQQHVFHSIAKSNEIGVETIASAVSMLTSDWWAELLGSMPEEWREQAATIGNDLYTIRNRAHDFAKDVLRSLI